MILKLTHPMPAYDFSKKPLAEADIVISIDGRCAKNRGGTAGQLATEAQTAEAVEVRPNR